MRIAGTPFTDEGNPVPAKNFCATLAANVNNKKLSDKKFREFVRSTLPIVEYPRPEEFEESNFDTSGEIGVPLPSVKVRVRK